MPSATATIDAEALTRAMARRGLSQRDLAERAGLSLSTVHKACRQSRAITERSLARIQRVLQDVSELEPDLTAQLTGATK